MDTFKKWVVLECILVFLLLVLFPIQLKKENKDIAKADSNYQTIEPYVAETFEITALPDLRTTPIFWKEIIRNAALEYGRDLTERELNTIYEEVTKWSIQYDIDKEIIFGIIETESQFYYLAKNLNNRNKTGDYGLMQVNTVSLTDFNNWTGRNLTEQDLLYDVVLNIEVGCWVLNQKKECLIRHDCYSVENLIYAYNAGQGRVLNDTVPQMTIDYGNNVLIAYNRYL